MIPLFQANSWGAGLEKLSRQSRSRALRERVLKRKRMVPRLLIVPRDRDVFLLEERNETVKWKSNSTDVPGLL